jgi:hypothetical protein
MRPSKRKGPLPTSSTRLPGAASPIAAEKASQRTRSLRRLWCAPIVYEKFFVCVSQPQRGTSRM